MAKIVTLKEKIWISYIIIISCFSYLYMLSLTVLTNKILQVPEYIVQIGWYAKVKI